MFQLHCSQVGAAGQKERKGRCVRETGVGGECGGRKDGWYGREGKAERRGRAVEDEDDNGK